MSFMRLLGFRTLTCGCIVGHYRERDTRRELAYIEEKGGHCGQAAHRRNHTFTGSRHLTLARPLTRAS